jgi:hypothetical protein
MHDGWKSGSSCSIGSRTRGRARTRVARTMPIRTGARGLELDEGLSDFSPAFSSKPCARSVSTILSGVELFSWFSRAHRSSASLGARLTASQVLFLAHYKPLCAYVDRTFLNFPNSSRRRPEKIHSVRPAVAARRWLCAPGLARPYPLLAVPVPRVVSPIDAP